MAVSSHQRSQEVAFFKIGLGGQSGKLLVKGNQRSWIIKTLTDIKATLGHANSTIDILKIDIEHAEWPSLVSMIENGELKNVRQFLIEFHTLATPDPREVIYRQRLHLMAEIEQLGFRRFYTHMNPWGHLRNGEYPDARTTAYEVYFVNTKLSRQQKSVQL